MESVYLETSFIGHLKSRFSANLRIASRQQITAEWWATKRHQFAVYVSDQVLLELGAGDPLAAAERLKIVEGIAALHVNDEVLDLAAEYMKAIRLPPRLKADAVHMAMASVFQMDYLLTWNLTHIANPHHIRKLTEIDLNAKRHVPLIVTPESIETWE